MPTMPGPMELLVVAALALIVFGPARLPEIARSVGKAVNELRRQAADLKAEFDFELDEEDDRERRTRLNERPTRQRESPALDPDPAGDEDTDAPGEMDPDPSGPVPEPPPPETGGAEPPSDKS